MAPAYWIMIAVLLAMAGVIGLVAVVSLGSGRRKDAAKQRELEAMAAVIARHRLDEAFVNLDADIFVGIAAARGELLVGSCTGDADSYRLDQISKVSVERGKPRPDPFDAAFADLASFDPETPARAEDPNRTAAINLRINLAGDARPALVIPFYDEKKSFLYLNIREERAAEAKHFRERLNQVRAKSRDAGA